MPRETSDEKAEQQAMLGLLSAVESDAHITQRSLAARLGVALGLTNAYLKRCALKGWIKVQTVPKRRYAYYLTPKGFAEKSRLTAEYLSSSFSFFRTARDQCLQSMNACKRIGWQRVALIGEGELAEVAAIVAMETGVGLCGIIAPGSNQVKIAGVEVVQSLPDLGPVDAVIVTDIKEPQKTYEALSRIFPAERILCPALLHVTPSWPDKTEDETREAV